MTTNFALLTRHDERFCSKMLYDPRLHAGMTAEEAHPRRPRDRKMNDLAAPFNPPPTSPERTKTWVFCDFLLWANSSDVSMDR